MTPARKSRRQSKPPAKLQDFVYQHGVEKEKEKVVPVPEKKKNEAGKNIPKKTIGKTSSPEKKTVERTTITTPEKILDDSLEPRRSGRTPKISARLKSYLNEKSETPDKPDLSTKKPLKKVAEASSKMDLNDAREIKEAQPYTPVAKRLKLQAQSTQGIKGTVGSKGTHGSKGILGTLVTKGTHGIKGSQGILGTKGSHGILGTKQPTVVMERMIVNTEKKYVTKRKGVAETVADLPGKNSSVKRTRLLDCADGKHSSKAQEQSVDTVKRINKDLMTELLNFGAEIIEAMSSSNEKIIELTTKENTKHKPLHTFEIDKDQDLDEDEVEKIIEWIEKEDEQRRNYRKKILDSMRMSHESNMALFMQLLNMLKSLSSSLRS